MPDNVPNDPQEVLEDQRLAELLDSLEIDAPPVDHAALASLRERSTQAYLHQAGGLNTRAPEKRSWFSIVAPWAAVATAAALLVSAVLWSNASAGDDRTFGAALDELAKAKSLELNVIEGDLVRGRNEQVLVKAAEKKLRWNYSKDVYEIALGDRQWEVAESANRVSERRSTFFPAGFPGFDLFSVVTLPSGVNRKQAESAKPVGQVEFGGRLCDHYSWRGMPQSPGGPPVVIEAWVDAQTRRLQSLQASSNQTRLLTVNVVAVDQPIDDSLFVVGKTLTKDGRVGKVADVQGIVTLQAALHERWTPVVANMLVHPGDWVRTDVRGANATQLRLVKDTLITLGPGTQIEVVSPSQIRLNAGELKVVAEKNASIELLGLNNEKLKIDGTAIVRLAGEKLTRLEHEPKWLAGFEGATAEESIGSLVAKVDGRDVPLTVGYHKVTVDIRDQIARTVIEESFVNHTAARTEGVFYFPLPQDASISGFGMWIGNELVEADIVEKQRAREIYETILREKRDPGLLEWTGGNIFKARVFPIEGHSEKRIKISYTQVLPVRDGVFRYSYGLRSELLKLHPLRELSVDVRLSSTLPLAGVLSPTHTGARIARTPHSAHVEFTAQEYTPDSDFELVAELEKNQPAVTLVPHRRGDDGYFMLMVSPPDSAGEWQRDVLPDTEPLDLVILADTSASMDAASRAAQAEFVAMLLSSLSPEDKFNLGTCDVECQWTFTESKPADETNINAARDALANRVSLGWTDLDRAFESVLAKAGPKSQVIYIGDGIVTTRDADPIAFSKRLRQMCQGKNVPMHSVAVSSSFEPAVLKTIASFGGGSVRQISGDRTPQVIATELLSEITKPTLRDMRVEFTGIQTARVYPRELPNLPTGSQQILLGRYLPQGADQHGTVTITGMLNGESVRYRTDVSLANVAEASEAENDMSFIPRLWARMHLDALLEQGSSQAIQDEIIGLSEEYHIITPYTSLLVLESDEDRERFKVKRRFQMRDAERFFAEGRGNVDYELLGQQMRRAGTWRIGLRQQVLAELMGLGRSQQFIEVPRDKQIRLNFNSFSGDYGYRSRDRYLGETTWGFHDRRGGNWFGESSLEYSGNGRLPMLGPRGMPVEGLVLDVSGFEAGQPASPQSWFGRLDLSFDESRDLLEEDNFASSNRRQLRLSQLTVSTEAWDVESNGSLPASAESSIGLQGLLIDGMPVRAGAPLSGFGMGGGGGSLGFGRRSAGRAEYYGFALNAREFGSPGGQYTAWMGALFPELAAMPVEEKPIETVHPWPAEARELVSGLLRTEALAKLVGGLRIERQSDGFNPRWDEQTSHNEVLELVSPASWLVRTSGIGSQTILQWADAEKRGIYSTAFQLGRERKSSPRDVSRPPLGLPSHTLTSLERSYSGYKAELRPQADGRVLLVLSPEQSPAHELHFLIDPARQVVVSIEQRQDGKVTSATRYDEFVEVAGAWWAGRTQTFDAEGRRTSVTTDKFTTIEAEPFAKELAAQLAGREQVQFISDPLPAHADARRDLDAGKADFNDQITLLLRFCNNQQWDKVNEHFEAANKLAAGKPGMRWVHDAIFGVSRRGEELKQRILVEAAELAKPSQDAAAAVNELFLANYLLSQANGQLAGNEMLGLLDVIKPVFERQPAYVVAMKGWTQQRVNHLRGAGQPDKAIALQKQLATDYPHDVGLQIEYASALFEAREFDAAYSWLDKLNVAEARWDASEDQRLRETYLGFLESHGRWSDALDYLAKWVGRNPESTTAYARYLGALLRLDRLDEMNDRIGKWLADGRKPGKIPPAGLARLNAAIDQALGQGHAIRTDRLDERWLGPLAETVRFFARSETNAAVAERIMNDRHFRESDQCRQLRREYLVVLQEQVAPLPPAEVTRFMSWVLANDPAVENDTWAPIATKLEERWAAESDPERKHQLAQPVVQILSNRFPDRYLEFLRRQFNDGPKKYRDSYADQLFNTLLGQRWTAEIEDETLRLSEHLADSATPPQKLRARVQALYRFTDRMVPARNEVLMAKVEHQEKLTRTELRGKQQKNLRLAREGLVDRLRQAREEVGEPLRPWINIERLYLETQIGRNLPQVAEECWEFLGPNPPAAPAPREAAEAANTADVDALLQLYLDQVLRTRYLITAANLAARREAKPELADKLLAYIDQGIAQSPPEDVAWKFFKYQMLIALDRADALEAALREWIRVDDPLKLWRVSLANVLAEQGKIAEAVTLLEAVQGDGELGPSEYRTLANWYLVLDQREKRESALVATFSTAEEWELQNWLWQQLRPWQYPGAQVPSELDQNVLRVFTTLFKKSGTPQNYAGQLAEFYKATRDFRLLAGLANSVTGLTAERAYPFLQGLTPVFTEIREEATVDSLVKEIEKARANAKTTLDKRALDLLEVIVERRACELQNQPGPHADRALAALRRAFESEWLPGEQRMMADFLASLGVVRPDAFSDEQLRELAMLHEGAAAGSADRLHIGAARARCVWAYGRHEEAIDLLESSLNEFRTANNGVLPIEANGPLDTYVTYLEMRNFHARGEQVLFEELKHPANPQQTLWLRSRLYRLYRSALAMDGTVSLGTGGVLFSAVQEQLQKELDTPDQNHRRELVEEMCNIYTTARDKDLPNYKGDLRKFAFERLPAVLEKQTISHQTIVIRVGETVKQIIGPRDGLDFLVTCIEREPKWFRYTNENGWRQFAYRLSDWRRETAEAGQFDAALQERLLAIVLTELRRDLESRAHTNRYMYHQGYGGTNHYWREKEADFARVANEVYDERKSSGAAVKYIAEYLYSGINRQPRAIEIMFVANGEKLLDEDGQSTLVRYLFEQGRHGESIALLEPLVKLRPDNIEYRTRLMHAYFRTGRQDELLALLKETDTYFHANNRWGEGSLAALGFSCLENALYEQSAAYYEELIPLHQRTQPNRGIGNGTLSHYYGYLARAYAGLKNTPKAVDAASGAIVSWGSSQGNRRDAIAALQDVLQNAPDLDAYVIVLDEQVKESGLENPIVRKAIGAVYVNKQQYDKAITQLNLARASQPNDVETLKLLVDCYDKKGDKAGAAKQLLASVQLSRRDIELYKDLGRRYRELEQPAEAERAATSIVEMLPNESESHAALAEIRQEQGRWGEAIHEWRRVSEIRALEPTGLLKVAAAQIHEQQWDAAKETIRQLRGKVWPTRFFNTENEIRMLEMQIEQRRSR